MPRTTIQNVKLLLDTALADAAINAFIASANRLMDTLFEDDEDIEDLLEELETWLTCHLIVSTREPTAESVSAAGVSVKMSAAKSAGTGLSSTSYGRQAMMLDTTGILSAWGSGSKVIPVVLV